MKYVLRRYIMKISTIIKGGIALSAVCAAALSIDNARLSKKAKGLEAELEAAKAETEKVEAITRLASKTPISSSAADYYVRSLADANNPPASQRSADDLYDELEVRGAELTERIIALGERRLAEAEAKQARREQRLAEKEARRAAKAEAKAARKAAKADA